MSFFRKDFYYNSGFIMQSFLQYFNYYLSYKRTQPDGDFTYKDINGVDQTRNNNYNPYQFFFLLTIQS